MIRPYTSEESQGVNLLSREGNSQTGHMMTSLSFFFPPVISHAWGLCPLAGYSSSSLCPQGMSHWICSRVLGILSLLLRN